MVGHVPYPNRHSARHMVVFGQDQALLAALGVWWVTMRQPVIGRARARTEAMGLAMLFIVRLRWRRIMRMFGFQLTYPQPPAAG